MRIGCPSCSAAYDVPDSLVTAGRVVRCARCGHEWTPVTAAPEAEFAETAAPSPPIEITAPIVMTWRPSAMQRLAAHPAFPPSTTRLRLAWAGSVLLLLLLAGAAYTWRSSIMAAWPPSTHAYAAFGLHTTTGTPQ